MKEKQNVPARRFPGFEGAWVRKKLGEVAEINRGKSRHRPRDADFLYGGKYPFVQTGDVKNAGFYLDSFSQTYSEAGLKQSKLWDEGTLCITIAANIAETTILKIKACFPDSVIGLIPYKGKSEVVFVKILFDKFKIDIQRLSQGLAQANLNQESLSNIEFYFPSLPEQQKIATFFTTIDQKISQLKQKKNLLEQYKKGAMQALFAQTLRFRADDGSDFPDWEEKKLGEVASNKSEKYNPEKDNYSVKCIELEHLTSLSGQLLGYTEGRNSGSIKNKFSKGDVLFGKLRPYLKKYLLAPFKGVCSSEIWVLKGKGVDNRFLYQLVQTDGFVELANQSSGSKMPRAEWSVVSNGNFLIPSLPEQQKIATFLSRLDERVALVEQQIAATEHWKKGLLQQMFC